MGRTSGQSTLLILLASAALAGGCGKSVAPATLAAPTPPGSTPTLPGGGGPPPPPPPPVTPAVPLALNMTTVYSGETFVHNLSFVETANTSCTATPGTPLVNCTVIVPEGQLYYSTVQFSFAWLPVDCKLLIFQPYYYLASTSAAYLAPGSLSPTDCTLEPKACWGGAAPELVSDFPLHKALIFLPDEFALTTPNAFAGNLRAANKLSYGSNRLSVNDLPAGKVGNTYTSAQLGGLGDGYVANSYVNYSLTCRDDWFDPIKYQINIFVTDEDSMVGNVPEDDFFTWKEAP